MSYSRVRTALTGAAAALLMTAAQLAGGAGADARTPPPAAWLQTGHDAAQSSANPAESVLSPSVVKRLALVRRQDASDGCPTGRVAAISGSIVYSVVGDVLRATRTDTGATDWTAPLLQDDERYVSIAVSDGLVILASNGEACETNDPIGLVRAYRTADGSLAWQGEVSFPDGISGLVVSGWRIVAYARAGLEASPDVSVLRVGTGRLVWGNATPDGPDPAVCDTAPAVVHGLVFDDYLTDPAQPDGCYGEQPALELRARALSTGAVSWTKPGSYTVLRGDTDARAGTAHLYVRDNATQDVLNLDPATGATRFALAGATNVLAVDGRRVYALCSAADSVACAFDKATGAVLWRAPLSHAWLPGPRHAVEADGVVYLGNGELRDARTGALLRTLPVDVVAVGCGSRRGVRPCDRGVAAVRAALIRAALIRAALTRLR